MSSEIKPSQPERAAFADAYAPRAYGRDAGLVVLKFGSSLLKSEECPRRVVHEIYRHVRRGQKVVAVVSARHQETDQLIELGNDLSGAEQPDLLPRLLRLGEMRSAANVALACARTGLRADVVDPHEFAFKAQGPADDAQPQGCDADALKRRLAGRDVVVVPGFVALNEDDQVVCLGRGGTDLTAVFLGHALNANHVKLVKDVDGVFEQNPQEAGGEAARPYASLSFDHARAIGGKVVQAKALDYADAHRVPVFVGGLARSEASHLESNGSGAHQAARKGVLTVALAGCGVVGGGVLANLQRQPDLFHVNVVLVRDVENAIKDGVPAALVTNDHNDPRIAKADVVVETMGGIDAAGDMVANALARGQDVVSANKALVADRPEVLAQLEAEHGGHLRYSAAVGGGVGAVEMVDHLVAQGKRIIAIEGVANGTCNFILDRMEEGTSLDDAISAAQAAGFAEADPSADIDGHDAAAKLSILAKHAFGVLVDPVAAPKESLRGLSVEDVAQHGQEGRRLRQVGRASILGDQVSVSVSLDALPLNAELAKPRGAGNAFRIVCADGEEVVVAGLGAGRWPTAEAVVGDLLDLHRVRVQSGQRVKVAS